MLYKLGYTLPAFIPWIKRKKHNFELNGCHNDQQKNLLKSVLIVIKTRPFEY